MGLARLAYNNFFNEMCKCEMHTNTQLWSINKEVWKSAEPSPPHFSAELAALHDRACSVSVNKDTVVFIGGHYFDMKMINKNFRYIPLKDPLNDLVFEYSFKTFEWTKFPSVPNIQVCL